MMRDLKGLLLAVGISCAVGCGGTPAADPPHDDESVTTSDELSMFLRSYVTARRDVRRCMAPLCGGYWIRDVNRPDAQERYVSALDFRSARLSDEEQQKIESAGDFELVLRGRLGFPDPVFRTRRFVVSEAWRGMPGLKLDGTEVFAWTEHRRPERLCIVAPCPNELVHLLNRAIVLEVSGFTFDSEALPRLLDPRWLEHELREEGAIAAGRVVDGESYPGGVEQLFRPAQLFVRFPLSRPGCDFSPPPVCGPEEAVAYARGEDLCVHPVSCVDQGICSLWMPICAEGYTLTSWPSTAHGCPQYACDPTFVVR